MTIAFGDFKVLSPLISVTIMRGVFTADNCLE